MEQPHPGGGSQTELEYRLAWARTYLKKYGLIDNSARGVWALTSRGVETTALDPLEVVRVVREQFARQRQAKKPITPAGEEAEPQEAGEEEASWRDTLLAVLMEMPPPSFERLCQRVLRESGFVQVEVTGRSGDGGIDGYGLVRLAGLLSFRVIFQCKRYRNNVSPNLIRDFRGAMIGRADKGLIITTGGFTRDSRLEAMRDGAPPIDLIDGDQLAETLKGEDAIKPAFAEAGLAARWFAAGRAEHILRLRNIPSAGTPHFSDLLLDTVTPDQSTTDGAENERRGVLFEAAVGLLLSATPGFEIRRAVTEPDEQVDLLAHYKGQPGAILHIPEGYCLVECRSGVHPVGAPALRDFGAKCFMHGVKCGILATRSGSTGNNDYLAAQLTRRKFYNQGIVLLELKEKELRRARFQREGLAASLRDDYERVAFGKSP